MNHNLVFKDRSFRLDVLVASDKFLCRFPQRDERSCYVDLSFFDRIDAINSVQYKDDKEDVIPSRTSCIVYFHGETECEFDCTPDQFVDILRVYRQLESVARNFI